LILATKRASFTSATSGSCGRPWADDEPEQVGVIGTGLYKAIDGLAGIRSDRVISQPQDRNQVLHLDGLRRLRAACSG
jgi:hypothetical protein